MNSHQEELGNLIRLTRQYIEKEMGPRPQATVAAVKKTPPPAPVKRVSPPPTALKKPIDEKPVAVDLKDQLATLKNFYPGLTLVDSIPTKQTTLLLLRKPHPFFEKIAEALEKRGVSTVICYHLSEIERENISLYLIEKPLSITKEPTIYLESAEQYEANIELKKALWEKLKTALHL